MIDEHFIWEGVVDYGSQMDVHPLIIVEPGSCQIYDSVRGIRNVGVFKTVNFRSVGDHSASAEMSDVVGVLSVHVYFSLIFGVILFCAYKTVFKESWFFVPPINDSIVLLKEIVSWGVFFSFVEIQAVSDVRSKYVTIDWDEELTRVVGVVVFG